MRSVYLFLYENEKINKEKIEDFIKKIDKDKAATVIKKLGSKSTGKTVATLAGLIGGPIGMTAAAYQSKKLEANERESDKRKGKLDFRKSDRTGRHMIRSIIGGVPIIGAVSNYDLVSKRHKLDDELEK